MPPVLKLKLAISPGIMAALTKKAAQLKVTVEDYATTVLMQAALGGPGLLAEPVKPETEPKPEPKPANPVGRPITVLPDDLPLSLERSVNSTGYAGVTLRGRLWVSHINKDMLGKFSSPELAAIVRHFVLLGFSVASRNAQIQLGADPVFAAQMAKTPFNWLARGALDLLPSQVAAGALDGPHPNVFDTSFTGRPQRGPRYRPGTKGAIPSDDLTAAELDALDDEGEPDDEPEPERQGPASVVTPARPAEPASPEGVPEPSTSAQTVPQRIYDDESIPRQFRRRPRVPPPVFAVVDTQVTKYPRPQIVTRAPMFPTPGICCGCGDPLPKVARKKHELCLLCNDDYVEWNKLPIGGQMPEHKPGDYPVNMRGSAPPRESFVAYVARVRGGST